MSPWPEPVQQVKTRRDAALERLVGASPYARYLGIGFDRRGDELTAVLHWSDHLIGNPALPALHGGVTAAFLETAALVELSWGLMWQGMEAAPDAELPQPRWPKTVDFSIDYLRPGLPRDAYARARIDRQGRRFASVHVEGWQDNRARLFAKATGHFLMPRPA